MDAIADADTDADANADADASREIELDAEKPLPPNWLPLLLWILGTMLAVAGVPLRSSSKPAFWCLVLFGSASVIAGTVLFVMYAKRTEATLQARQTLLLLAKHDDVEMAMSTTRSRTQTLKSSVTPPDAGRGNRSTGINSNSNANANADVTTGSDADAYGYANANANANDDFPLRRRSKSARRSLSFDDGDGTSTNTNVNVTWMDDNKPAGSPLAAIKHFRQEEPSNVLQSEAVMMAPDHAPKPVPALLPSKRLGYEKPYACGPANFGFTATSYDAMAINPLDAAKDTAPLFYTPPSQYPTVDDIATERQRFWSRPETPETDRTRREGLLLEAAFQLGAPNDRSMVPVTTVVASTTPEF